MAAINSYPGVEELTLCQPLLNNGEGKDPCCRQAKSPGCGYGSCSVSGCPCPAYKDTYGSQLCNNCGHQYTDHW
jgi:hypothetical protein